MDNSLRNPMLLFSQESRVNTVLRHIGEKLSENIASFLSILVLSSLLIGLTAKASSPVVPKKPGKNLTISSVQAFSDPAVGADVTFSSCTVPQVLASGSASSETYVFSSSNCDANGFTATVNGTSTVQELLITSTSGQNILKFERGAANGKVSSGTFKSTSGAAFKLTNLSVVPSTPGTQTITVTPYKSGTAGTPVTINYTSSSLVFTNLTSTNFGTNFDDIDEISISTTSVTGNFGINGIVTTNPVLPATTINSLNTASSNPTNAATVNYTATFGTAITGLTASNFSITPSGVSGAAVGPPTTGDGGTTWTVPVTTGTGNGTIVLNLANATGLSLGISTTLPFSGQTYTINKTAPVVSSITATGSSPNNASSDAYTVTFSENVTGVAAGDFTATTTGSVASTGITVTGSGTTYTLTVTGVTGDGTLRLDLKANSTGITDAAGNTCTAAFTGGSVYTIQHTSPVVSSITATGTSPNNASSDAYTVTFSEAVTGVTSGAFTATTSGVSTTGITVTPVSSSVYTVTVSGVSGNGTLRLDLNSGGTGIADLAGNAISGGFTGGDTYTIDKTAPTVSISTPSVTYANSNAAISYTVTFTDTNMNTGTLSNFGALAVYENSTVTGTATINSISVGAYTQSGNGYSFPVTFNDMTGDGTLSFSVPAGTVSDNAGNTSPASSASANVIIDNTPPVVIIGSPSTTLTNTGPVSFDVSFADANFNSSSLSNANIILNSTAGTSASSVSVTPNSATDYTVTLSGITGDGTLGISIQAGISSDLAGNADAGAGPSTTFAVDNTPPTVSSITATGSSPTNATSVGYTVIFSEAVTGVTSGAFTATTSGATTSGITITPVSGSVYTVTVNGVSGNGTVRLDLNSNYTGIADLAGNAISGGFTGGNTYTIDNTAPTVTISAPSVTYANSNAAISYTVTFTDANMNTSTLSNFGALNVFENSDVMGTATINSISVGTYTQSGNSYSFPVTFNDMTGDGTLSFTVPAGTVSDNAGNTSPVSSASANVIIDNTPPTATISAPSVTQVGNSGSGSVSYTVTYADANVNTSSLTTSGITLNTTGTAAGTIGVSGSGTTYTVTISDITGLGTLGISVGSGFANDLAGNTDLGAGPSSAFAVLSSNAYLGHLSISSGTLKPVAGTPNYTVNVSNATVGVTVTPFTTDPTATVTVGVNGGTAVSVTSGTPSGNLPLNVGANTITVTVTAQDGVTTQPYIITVTRAQSSNTYLSHIAISSGTLTPVAGTPNYTVNVSNATAGVTVTPFTTDPTATVTVGVNGGTAAAVTSGTPSADLPLNVGANTITVTVTAQDGVTTQPYIITVTRAQSSVAYLSHISISSGTLTPVAGTSNYTVNVSNAASSVTVTPFTTDPTATVTVGVNGGTAASVTSGTPSGNLALNVGANTITVTVTAQDGVTTQPYIITVTRAQSSNTYLSHISISSGTLVPVAGTPNYTVNVSNATAGVTVTPFTTDPTATVTVGVNGGTAASVTSGTPSGNLPLNVGANTITVTVTAQDGVTTQPYIITVTRAQSSNTYMSHISISSGTLVPVAGTPNYTVNVAYATSSVTVTPFTSDPTATVTVGVNGGTAAAVTSGTPSGNLPLNVGTNTITVTVTAQDGVTTQPYTLTVTRAASGNTYLSHISISAGTLTPVTGTQNYTVNVTNATASITVTPFTTDPGQTVTIDGTAVASGTPSAGIPLSIGTNTITIIVTAPDGVTTQSYIITVSRAPSSNIYLTHLAISSGTLVPVTGTPNYTDNVTNAVTAVTVTPVSNDPSSTMTISVNGGTSAPIASGTPSAELPLNVGSNNITIIVTAQDGVTTQPFVITVTRATGPLMSLHLPVQQISVTKPTDTVTIENDGIMVHQGVSPNGDGINDVLTIDGINQYPDNQLTIIDRNGALLYHAKGYDNSSKAFDGHSSINGKLLQAGTYFYSLDYSVNGQSKHKTGYVLLKY